MSNSTATIHNSKFTANTRGLTFKAVRIIETFVQFLVHRYHYSQTVTALSALSDYELEDIGLVRGNIKEAVKSSLR